MNHLDRTRLHAAWKDHYELAVLRLGQRSAVVEAKARASRLEGKMRQLARRRERYYKDYSRRGLEVALGMSLGVHKQLLWGLTSSPGGTKLRVVGGS